MKLTWVKIGKGGLTSWPQPLISECEEIQKEGVTLVVSLQEESEGVQKLGEEFGDLGISWLWFPLKDFKPVETEKIWKLCSYLAKKAREGARILVHCHAGLDRTGSVVYRTLRCAGFRCKNSYDWKMYLRKEYPVKSYTTSPAQSYAGSYAYGGGSYGNVGGYDSVTSYPTTVQVTQGKDLPSTSDGRKTIEAKVFKTAAEVDYEKELDAHLKSVMSEEDERAKRLREDPFDDEGRVGP